MITARDVAEKLGIAVSTVGRAMADDPRISAKTKAKVRKAAERMGYVGNNPARVMRGGSSKLIGLMIPDVANDFYGSVAQTLSTCFDREGYGLVLSLTGDDREREMRQIRELVGARVAGIILVPTARPKRESKRMLSQIAHIQFLRRHSALGQTWFGMDDSAVVKSATRYLIERGHRHIGYIGANDVISTGAARANGFRMAFSESAVAHHPELERHGVPTVEYGEAAAEDLLARARRVPSAIITGSIHITLGLIRYIERAKIKTPEQLSLIGFGEAPWFEWWRGGLTTIQPSAEDLATSCGLWFLEQVRKGKIEPLPAYASVTISKLAIRSSVAEPMMDRRRRID